MSGVPKNSFVCFPHEYLHLKNVKMMYYRSPASKHATTHNLQKYPDNSVTEEITFQSW